MFRLTAVAALIGLVIGTATGAYAQDATPFAHLSYTEGRVVVEHETTSEEVDGNTPLLAGDRIRTEDGRAEVLFGDGSLVQLDQQTTMDVLAETVVRIMSGRVIVRATSARAGQLQIDTPAGSVFVEAGGEYHVGLTETDGRPTLDLAVVRGRADIASDVERLTVDAGQRAWARPGEAPSYPVAFNSAELDPFEQWAADRLDARRGTVSYQYVSAPLRPYAGILDAYGSWGYQAPYGYVWYPRVDVGWRPYYHGRWRFYASIGWTWIGGGVWAWPTHHYGRWGFVGSRWFWIPGHTWGPGFVHWAVAPGYVSWCPLGFDNRPIFAFNHYGHYRGHYGHRFDSWRGWTVVPRRHFGGYASVSRVAVDGRALFCQRSAPAFVERAPAPLAVTASRRADGGRSVTTTRLGAAVPRGTASPDRFASRQYSAGPSVTRAETASASRSRLESSLPETGRARARAGAVPRDGGYVSIDNGSRVYRVPPASAGAVQRERSGARSPAVAESNPGARARLRTAPDDRRTTAAPSAGYAARAPFAGDAAKEAARLRRTAPRDGGSLAVPGNEPAARARAPFTSERAEGFTRGGRSAPVPPARSVAPPTRSFPRATAPYVGGDRRTAPAYQNDRPMPRALPGALAPSSRQPSRVRPSYERPASPGGGIRNDSMSGYRARPQASPRMSGDGPPGGGRPPSYAPRPDSGGGSRMRQAPAGAGHGSGSGRAVSRGGRHR